MIRLPKPVNQVAKENARDAGVSKEEYLATLIEEYAVGAPHPGPPKDPPVEVVETRAAIETAVFDRAMVRARAEGRRGLSNAIAWMLGSDDE